MKIDSLYISVKDMDQALEFYKKLFNQEPTLVDKRYSIFDLDGFSFGLYNPEVDDLELKIGNNCVPDFQVKDVVREYERIKEFAPEIDEEIKDYEEVRLFQFKDSEGNLLEVYEKKS